MKSVPVNSIASFWNRLFQATFPSMIAGSLALPPADLLPAAFRAVSLAFQSALFLFLFMFNNSSRFRPSWSSGFELLLVQATVLVADNMISGYA